jgi:hypothetical protein
MDLPQGNVFATSKAPKGLLEESRSWSMPVAFAMGHAGDWAASGPKIMVYSYQALW